jgi:hypothetical protein
MASKHLTVQYFLLMLLLCVSFSTQTTSLSTASPRQTPTTSLLSPKYIQEIIITNPFLSTSIGIIGTTLLYYLCHKKISTTTTQTPTPTQTVTTQEKTPQNSPTSFPTDSQELDKFSSLFIATIINTVTLENEQEQLTCYNTELDKHLQAIRVLCYGHEDRQQITDNYKKIEPYIQFNNQYINKISIYSTLFKTITTYLENHAPNTIANTLLEKCDPNSPTKEKHETTNSIYREIVLKEQKTSLLYIQYIIKVINKKINDIYNTTASPILVQDELLEMVNKFIKIKDYMIFNDMVPESQQLRDTLETYIANLQQKLTEFK